MKGYGYMNNRGFTLVELLATLVILAIVLTIGSFSIIKIIEHSKEKNFNLLLGEIRSAAEMYYQECKYGESLDDDENVCSHDNGIYITKLSTLVSYGFLKGNDTIKDDRSVNYQKYTIINPNDEVNISECEISIKYDDGVVVDAVAPLANSSCPNHCNFFPKDSNCKKNG